MIQPATLPHDCGPSPVTLGKVLCLTWLACVLAFALIAICRVSLGPLSWSFPLGCAFYGLYNGSMAFVVPSTVFILPVGPAMALIWYVARVIKVPQKTIRVLFLPPLLALIFLTAKECMRWRADTYQPEIFTRYTGMPYPQNATLLKRAHGWGGQDQRHLWVFESTPEQFESFKAATHWAEQEGGMEEVPMDPQGLAQVRVALQPTGSWSAAKTYIWEADKNAEAGPFGPVWLCVDRDRRRWFVWWCS